MTKDIAPGTRLCHLCGWPYHPNEPCQSIAPWKSKQIVKNLSYWYEKWREGGNT